VETPDVSRIGAYIKEQRETARVSLRRLAQDAGVSNPYLSQIERGLRKPSAEILQQLAKALRISAEQLYLQAGLLDEIDDQPSVPLAIHADAALTDRQKRVLLDIYDSFLPEPSAPATPTTGAAAKPKASTNKPKPKPKTTKTTATKSTAAKSTAAKSTAAKSTAAKPTIRTTSHTSNR
jgi:transcriptional regulator with XRE-family HTH domain